MQRGALGVLVAATIALAGCADGEADEKRATDTGLCKYDAETLLPAMKAAIPAGATVRTSMEMAGGGQDIAIDAVVAHTSGGGEVDMTFSSAEQEFALIVVDGRVFYSDSLDRTLYREFDDSDPVTAELRSQADDMDITSEFAAWDAGLENVEQSGEKDIDGEPTCRYSIDVDAADAAEAEGEAVVPGMPETITYEVYLDANDLMRRITFELGGFDAEVNATDWNEPVDIRAPAPAQLQKK